MTVPKLFTPIQVGRSPLAHRIVMAPLTRMRADAQHVHTPLAIEYYAQRASTGTLLISEGTFPTAQGGGLNNVPGIWSDAQVAAWKPVRLYRCCLFPIPIPDVDCRRGTCKGLVLLYATVGTRSRRNH